MEVIKKNKWTNQLISKKFKNKHHKSIQLNKHDKKLQKKRIRISNKIYLKKLKHTETKLYTSNNKTKTANNIQKYQQKRLQFVQSMSYLRNHPRKTFTYQINGANVKIEPFNIEKYPKYLANVKVSLRIGTNKYYVKNVNEFNELRENDIGRIWSNYHGWCDFDASFKNVYYKDWRIWYKWQMRPSYSCKYSWQRPWSCQHYDSVLAANNIYKHKIYNQFVRDQIKYHYHQVNKRATKLQAESEKKRKQIAEKKKQIAEKKKRKQIAELQQQSIKNYFQPEMVQGNDN
eukprot:86373_1